jgi:hypothetical protein
VRVEGGKGGREGGEERRGRGRGREEGTDLQVAWEEVDAGERYAVVCERDQILLNCQSGTFEAHESIAEVL